MNLEEVIKPKLTFGGWIEKNRIVIGTILLLGIIGSGTFLFWRENNWKPAIEKRVEALEAKTTAVGSQESVTKAVAESSSVDVSALISASQGNTAEVGKVAGVSTAKSAIVPAPAQVQMININTADAKGLDALPGIGPVLSQRIVDYRTANGPFSSIEQIKKVKGIGDSLFGKMKDQITI